MLVLTLSPDQQLHIGDEITLNFERKFDPVLQRCAIPHHSKAVTVAITAPRDIAILREELVDSPEDTP